MLIISHGNEENIRPNDNNYIMEIEDDGIRKSVENLVKLYLEHDKDGLA